MSSAPNGSSINRTGLRQRAGDRHTLLHAARQLVRVVAHEVSQANQVGQLGDPSIDLALRTARDLERQRDIGRHRPPVEQDGRLEDDPELASAAGLDRVDPVDDDPAAGRPRQPGNEAQERRLAAAGRPDERDERPDRDVEADVLERLDRALAGHPCRRPRRRCTGSCARQRSWW
jgi:hypothetical protein